jgi:hypothetical protein
MTSSKRKSSIRQKVANYRERKRAQGLRPVQIWVPDTRTAEFRAEAHRQSLAAAQSPTEKEDQAFVDSISVWNDDSFCKE